jgi:ATP-dependent DNA helicase DinG
MTEALSVAGLLAPDGLVARRLPGYESRPQQLELALAVERAIEQGGHLLAEAGTGVGKSFAYLLPAVLHACRDVQEGPIVVSTRTIALQEQLDRKDLPFLAGVLPLEWSAVTAIGRGNYVCLRRMHLAVREGRSLFDEGAQQRDLAAVADWAATTSDGTRMSLPAPVADEVWDEVRAEHGNCLHKLCKHYESCHWQRARRRMEHAQVLVVNHALYLADVALRMAGARYLPAHRVAIFDEAHHLERIATEALGLRATRGSVRWHLRRLHARRGSSLLVRVGAHAAIELCRRLDDALDTFFGALTREADAAPDRMVDLAQRGLEDPLSPLLRELHDALALHGETIEEVDLKTELQARARGVAAAGVALSALCRPGGPGLVRWIEGTRHGAELRAAPLQVAGALRQHLFQPLRSAVLVSATLGPGDDAEFQWLRRQLGIGAATTLRLGSPFDFARQMRVQLDEALPDPARDPEAFTRQSIARIERHLLANRGRALVLCTSWRFVEQAAAALREPLAAAGIELLVQGSAPLARLLETKRREPATVLLGTDTLWEGIDLPGEALTLVLVARFPFAPPGHPLVRARIRAIEEQGGDGFQDHTLPEAVLKFRQGVGRLIRTGTDHGKVVILDPRARTKGFGRRFLAAFPDGVEIETADPDR